MHCCWHGQKTLTKEKTNLKGVLEKEIANPGIIHIRLITEPPGEH